MGKTVNSIKIKSVLVVLLVGLPLYVLAGGGSPPPPPTGVCGLTTLQPSGIVNVSSSSATISPTTGQGAVGCLASAQDVVTTIRASVATTAYSPVGGFRVLGLRVSGGLSKYAWQSSVQGRLIQSSCDSVSVLCEDAGPTSVDTDPNFQYAYKQFVKSVFCDTGTTFQPNSVQVLTANCYFEYKLNRIAANLARQPLTYNFEPRDIRGDPPVATVIYTDDIYEAQPLFSFPINTFFIPH
jgi:hypothetical protein